MTTTVPTPDAVAARRRAQALAARLLHRAWCTLRELPARLARRRRLARMHATLAALDEATLRDLGLARAEATTYWAEAEGLRPPRSPHVVVRRPWPAHTPYLRPVAP